MKNKPEQNCAQCKNGYVIRMDGHILCRKFGIIEPAERCRHFVFDPLRRQPLPRVRSEGGYTEEDFSID